MKGTLQLKTAPASEPVTLTEAKAHMRVDISDDDTLITSLLLAARRFIENYTGIRMITQTWYYRLDAFPSADVLVLPVGPVSAISSIKYTDSALVEHTFASASYSTDLASMPARIGLRDGYSWPSATLDVLNGVVVEFVCGFNAASTLAAARAGLVAAEATVAAATAETLAAAQTALAAAQVTLTAAETAEASAVPEDIRTAMKLLVSHWYENREGVTTQKFEELPLGIQSLISQHKMWQGGGKCAQDC